MSAMALRVAALILIGSGVSAAEIRAQETIDLYRVPAQYANCIISKQAQYLAPKRQLVKIYPTLCPDVIPSPEQIARLAQNSGVEINPDSETIIVPSRKAKCFFQKLAKARRAAPSATAPIWVDISRCG